MHASEFSCNSIKYASHKQVRPLFPEAYVCTLQVAMPDIGHSLQWRSFPGELVGYCKHPKTTAAANDPIMAGSPPCLGLGCHGSGRPASDAGGATCRLTHWMHPPAIPPLHIRHCVSRALSTWLTLITECSGFMARLLSVPAQCRDQQVDHVMP